MEPINFFNAMAYLEPKCPQCQHKIAYGLTTSWDDNEQAHVCNECRSVLR